MPRCKLCKIKFVAKRFLQKHCMLNEECTDAEIKMVVENNRKLSENKEKKDWNEKKKVMKVTTHSKKYKDTFQAEINKLARMIDLRFEYYTCIDCKKGYGSQQDGAHYHGVGGNNTTRYNLDNIHSANTHCNKHSDTHKEGYKLGLFTRYGQDYLDYVLSLPLLYKHISLTPQDVVDKLEIVRKIIRDFDTFKFESSLDARTQLNNLIGIYNSKLR